MFHRLTRHTVRRLAEIVGLVTLAGCCAVVLHTRVYERFDRVRIRVVTSALQSDDGAVVVPISEAISLAGMPTALILRLQNNSPIVGQTVKANGGGSPLDCSVTPTSAPSRRSARRPGSASYVMRSMPTESCRTAHRQGSRVSSISGWPVG